MVGGANSGPNRRNAPLSFGDLSLTSDLRDALSLLLGLSASYLQNVYTKTGQEEGSQQKDRRLLALNVMYQYV